MRETDTSKSKKPNRLGRGLGSLFGNMDSTSAAVEKPSQPVKNPSKAAPANEIKPSPTLKSSEKTEKIEAILETNIESKNQPHQKVTAATTAATVAATPKVIETPAREEKKLIFASESVVKAPANPTIVQSAVQVNSSVTGAGELKEDQRIWIIAVDKIKPSKDQPRKEFLSDELKDLAASIKQKGIIQPITARRGIDGELEIVAGERRWRAAQMAGLHEVPVIIKKLDKQSSLEVALIENIQRHDLNPIEEAEAYQLLLAKYHLTQQQVADRVGKERATVANFLRLLTLAPLVRDHVKAGELSVGHAKVLMSLADHAIQIKIAKKIMNLRLSVRAAERLVEQEKSGLVAEDSEGDQISSEEKKAKIAIGDLQRFTGKKVSLDFKAGKGKLAIHFFSTDELSELLERIKTSWKV